ncbi:hypothetical protein [Streptomyces sp. RG80]|uniref:hypothetical protein n=1 Tax=Streptomyces sp. RG80 TaxID=3157340 RepID=UPI00338D6803
MVFLGIAFSLALTFMSWKVVQLWANPGLVDHFMNSFTILPFGENVRRGEVRSLGLTVVGLWSIMPMFFLGLYDVEQKGILLILSAAFVFLVLLCVLLEVCVVLFNWPKFVVPPHMRSDLGVIAERRAHRRATRKKPEGR